MRQVLVVAALLVSGCASEPAVEAEAPSVIDDPSDFEGSAQGSHVHDYWGGRETLTVVDGADGCGGPGCEVWVGGDHGVPLGHFRPEPDHVVPLGTAWLHATASWSVESGDYKDIALYVKTANTTSPSFVGVLEQDVTFTFNSTNDDNDPPHHRLSLWEFEVRARSVDGDGASASDFEVNLKVDVERGLGIPVFPPHPDHWNGTDELLLHESSRVVTYQVDFPVVVSFCSGCLGSHSPDDGAIVPPTATEVEVVLEVTDGLPGTFSLLVHGADTWDHEQVAPTQADDTREHLVWRLPVEGRPDSPYAKQSLWSIYVVNDMPTPVKFWHGSYDITVKALR